MKGSAHRRSLLVVASAGVVLASAVMASLNPAASLTRNANVSEFQAFIPGLSSQDMSRVQITLELTSFEAVAGADLTSGYSYTIRNDGPFPIDLTFVSIQSWYSTDTNPGGSDDCGAGGARIGLILAPGDRELAPGEQIALTFAADLTPNAQFWPQCVNRDSGFVVVEVHTRTLGPYQPAAWWESYAVSR